MEDLSPHSGEAPRREGGPSEPPAEDAVLVRQSTLERLEDDLATVKQMLRQQSPTIPKQHKYSMTERTLEIGETEVRFCDVGIRLVTGHRPTDLSEERIAREADRAPSRRVIQRLTSDEDCVLRAIKVGGRSYVTEASIQHYEEGLAAGWISGYQVLDAVKARK